LGKQRLLLATNNPGKAAEYRALLKGCGWEVVTPRDLGLDLEVEEAGGNYAENARIKATAFAKASGLVALADDSGIEVDALGGAPGPLSARFGGDDISDGQRVALLLRQLEGVPPEKRSARFRCFIAVARPDGQTSLFEGHCEGQVADEPRGEGGFGYDPVFLLPERGLTLAELPPEEKNAVSHRGRAARRARAFLEGLSKNVCPRPSTGSG
jgi:XTP/dITP diphosphohydrolase